MSIWMVGFRSVTGRTWWEPGRLSTCRYQPPSRLVRPAYRSRRPGPPAQCWPDRPPVKASLRLAALGLDGARAVWPSPPIGAGLFLFSSQPDTSLVMKTGHFHLLTTNILPQLVRWFFSLPLLQLSKRLQRDLGIWGVPPFLIDPT